MTEELYRARKLGWPRIMFCELDGHLLGTLSYDEVMEEGEYDATVRPHFITLTNHIFIHTLSQATDWELRLSPIND